MALSFISLHALLSILLFLPTSPISAQSTNTNVTDFSCSSSSCNTYAVYQTQTPDFVDLIHLSNLFGVSPLSIRKANNLPSEYITLLPNQYLLIPILCGCSGNRSFANITYEIKEGDSFYLVSINAFENLTDYHAVMALNPALEPTKLKPGQDVVFPIYCKCPSKTQLDQGLNYLITYVWQVGDEVPALSKKMNTSTEALITVNNYRNLSAAINLPVLIPVSRRPPLPSLRYFDTKSNSKSSTALVVVSSLLGAVLALVLLSFLVFAFCRSSKKKSLVRAISSSDTSALLRSKQNSYDQSLSPRVMVDKLLSGVTEYIDKPVVFEAKAIMEATMNLDDRFRLGSSVYRATVKGEVFAVKQKKDHDVTEELNILRKVNHANLVKLAGVSPEIDGSLFLVYEFAENGSLDKWLYPETQSSKFVNFLSWKLRLTIALHVANGLQYMHEHTRPSIVHGDIRASNILLNSSFKAKISNFSRAKPASTDITPKSDVFAFGIVLLELLSGRRAVATREGGQIEMLRKEIRMVLEVEEKAEEMLKKWMDSRLETSYPIDGALSLASMARACTSEVASERPAMSEIVFSLSILAYSCSGDHGSHLNSLSLETLQITNPVVAR